MDRPSLMEGKQVSLSLTCKLTVKYGTDFEEAKRNLVLYLFIYFIFILFITSQKFTIQCINMYIKVLLYREIEKK